MRRSSAGTAKTLEKLEKSVQAGNYYEAQQMYKSLYARYVSVHKYREALDLLQSGASIQLRHGQVACGAELALLFVETLIKAKIPYRRETLDRICAIFNEFPQVLVPHKLSEEDDMQKLSEILLAAKARVNGCTSFLKAAIKWSAEYGGPGKGAPELYDMLAQYISSQSPELCYPGEADLAIARGVLMYLASGDLRNANCLMGELREHSRTKEIELPNTPLLQFVEYLLLVLERDALPLFQILRQKYMSNINRDSSFNELLDEIAERFYGVRHRSGLQSILGDIFKSMI